MQCLVNKIKSKCTDENACDVTILMMMMCGGSDALSKNPSQPHLQFPERPKFQDALARRSAFPPFSVSEFVAREGSSNPWRVVGFDNI